MCQNEFEYFLLEINDKIIHNRKMRYNIDCDVTNKSFHNVITIDDLIKNYSNRICFQTTVAEI